MRGCAQAKTDSKGSCDAEIALFYPLRRRAVQAPWLGLEYSFEAPCRLTIQALPGRLAAQRPSLSCRARLPALCLQAPCTLRPGFFCRSVELSVQAKCQATASLPLRPSVLLHNACGVGYSRGLFDVLRRPHGQNAAEHGVKDYGCCAFCHAPASILRNMRTASDNASG